MAEKPFAFETTPGQLPKNIVPLHYDIHLRTDLAKMTTRGTVVIQIAVLKATGEIVLNANDLKIEHATIEDKSVKEMRFTVSEAKQTVTFKAPRKLKPGNYTITIDYSGKIREEAQGLFAVKYETGRGKKVMLATQMEPTDARRMVPCWDEPVFRATYDLSVTLPGNFKAYSNMPISRETPLEDGTKLVSFGQTPAMSSYLLVLVAGELVEIGGASEGVKVHVVTTEGKGEQARFALVSAEKLISYYGEYFGIKYPLPKLDLIAVPGGFEGAMENWGGITFNESILLYDPQKSNPGTRREIFLVVAHEMAHQWFGNLVTTAWWDNLWLNEGFATWMETKATDHFHPEWQCLLTAASSKSRVMDGDSRSSTHPIQKAVENEAEANDAFDSITYEKGGAFLRMLEDYLGKDTFRDGIRRYLAERRYSSATTADLWNALEAVSLTPIQEITTGWTEQPGLPVISVKSVTMDGVETLLLKQERFTVLDQGAKNLRWQIPVTIGTPDTSFPVRRILMDKPSMPVEVPVSDPPARLNFGDNGYYRVVYEPQRFEAMQKKLSKYSPADRLDILNNCWALVESGRASGTNYLSLINDCGGETSEVIWNGIISRLFLIDQLEKDGADKEAFREFARNFLGPQFKKLGWNADIGESLNDTLMRSETISALGFFGDQEVIAGAKSRFAEFLRDNKTLPPELRGPVFEITGRYADRSTYDQLHQLGLKALDTEERRQFYGALCGALDPVLAKSTLQMSLTNELNPEEAVDLIYRVAGNEQHVELAWEFTKTHLKEILLKVVSFNRDTFIPSVMGAFSDFARADELEAFVRSNISREAAVKASETATEIRVKATIKKEQIPAINLWLKKLKNQ